MGEQLMTDCLFCKLANKEIPTEIVYESDQVFAFKDVSPQAPCHVVVIPKKHISTINDLGPGDSELIAEMMLTAAKLAKELKIDASGYRVLFNCNPEGGQDIYHIHLHLLGGRQMTWPPG